MYVGLHARRHVRIRTYVRTYAHTNVVQYYIYFCYYVFISHAKNV